RRARAFARPAVEAQVEVAAHVGVHLQLAVGDRAHQVDAAARAVGLVAQLDVGGAGGRTQAAVDTIKEQFVVDAGTVLRGGQAVQRGPRRVGGGGHVRSHRRSGRG